MGGQSPTVAIMQPYLFPYLGYYQLLHYADIFVLYDDVNYIKRGFINRNTLLANGKPQRFTLPVVSGSQNRLIKDVKFTNETGKLLKTIRHNYARAPFFHDVFPLIESVLNQQKRDIAEVCRASLVQVANHLGISLDVRLSSQIDYDRQASSEGKLISICQQLDSKRYVNTIGGQKLYDKCVFGEKGISLSFIHMGDVSYTQGSQPFVANLSFIDVLMWCPKEQVPSLLNQYHIV